MELVDDVEVVNPRSGTIEALDGATARVPIELSVEEFSAHRIIHSGEIHLSRRLHMQCKCKNRTLSIKPRL